MGGNDGRQKRSHLAYLFSNRGVKTLLIVKCERWNRVSGQKSKLQRWAQSQIATNEIELS